MNHLDFDQCFSTLPFVLESKVEVVGLTFHNFVGQTAYWLLLPMLLFFSIHYFWAPLKWVDQQSRSLDWT